MTKISILFESLYWGGNFTIELANIHLQAMEILGQTIIQSLEL